MRTQTISTALRRLAPLAAVGGLLALAAAVASMSTAGVHHIHLPLETPPATPAGGASRSGDASAQNAAVGAGHPMFAIPSWVQHLLAAVGVAVVLTIVMLFVWHITANAFAARAARVAGRPGRIIQTRRDVVLAAVDAGIAELARDDGDPRSAVIVCWVRLEEAAAAAGTPRASGDTPADLVRRLLRAHQVSASVLDGLAELYRVARYSPGDVDPAMREAARGAFARLRDELAHSRSGPLEHDEVMTASGPVRPAAPRPRPQAAGHSQDGD